VARECVELRPEWPRSHWCKGSALEGVGRHGEALDAFKKALELDPENEVRILHLPPLLAAQRCFNPDGSRHKRK
jgi:tetratricopeptide (TPR) repeat protein